MKKNLTLLFLVMLANLQVHAVRTREISHQGFAAFEKAELQNLSITEDGILATGPSIETVAELQASLIWTARQGKDGTLFVATGNKGRIIVITPDGKTRTIFEPEEILARALAIGPDNALYVGTSPNGRIYRVPLEGRAEIYFDPEDTYIWDLRFDDKGSLFVATGNRGRVYRVPPNFKPGDKAELWYESVSSHFVSLAFDNKGKLLVGSDPDGNIYRMTEPFEATVLYNSDGGEVRKIHAQENGEIFFSTFKRNEGTSSSGNSGSSSKNSSSSDKSGKSVASSSSSSAKSIFYKIKPSGFVEVFWRNPSEPIFSFQNLGKDGWLLGTGDNGHLYQVGHDGAWKLLQTLEYGGEITSILKANDEKGGHLLFTSNPANIYRLNSGPAENGTLVSSTVDVKQVAKWGRIHTSPKSDKIQLFTRGGNTPKVNGTWTEWQPVNKDGRVTGAARRYLQYKTRIEGSDTILSRVRLFYQLNNAVPIIRHINIVPTGFTVTSLKTITPILDINKLTKSNLPDSPPPPPPIRKQLSLNPEDGLFTAGWDAYDPNGDTLEFKVQMRKIPTDNWITLGKNLANPVHTFTTKGMDDGYYQVKVTASDHASNPPGTAEDNFLVSKQFLIDNAAPQVRPSLKNPPPKGGAIVEISTEDSFSIIRSAEYILDGSNPVHIFPSDLLFDAGKESFRIELKGLHAGSHSLIVNATDDRGNRGTSQTTFEVE
jgi:hypothetical protein